jgi:hypothetical protein
LEAPQARADEERDIREMGRCNSASCNGSRHSGCVSQAKSFDRWTSYDYYTM